MSGENCESEVNCEKLETVIGKQFSAFLAVMKIK